MPAKPRFPLQGSFKGDMDISVGIDVDMDMDSAMAVSVNRSPFRGVHTRDFGTIEVYDIRAVLGVWDQNIGNFQKSRASM